MDTINTTGTPIFSWCPEIEKSALDQMIALTKLPFVKFAALMPDAHTGMTMPIGGVIACENVIIPNCVGVDIACGMAAVKTNLMKEQLTESIKKDILHSINRSIPTGMRHNDQKRQAAIENRYGSKIDYILSKSNIDAAEYRPFGSDIRDQIIAQLGTLGGGNHFLELQYDATDCIWVMVHSGSRNIGKRVCDFFNKTAKEINARYHSVVPEEVPFLPTSSIEGKDYIKWMRLCEDFSYLNRIVMLDEVYKDIQHIFKNIEFEDILNIHHNYARLENHFGKNYWIHRKGAVYASEGNMVIIPGSMGTSSYIARGLGNVHSMQSCSHGAGRIMSRTAFNLAMNTEDGLNQIEESLQGVEHLKFEKGKSHKGKETGMLDVSEAPQAYKDIDAVMENQKDLVEPVTMLRPLISLKDN